MGQLTTGPFLFMERPTPKEWKYSKPPKLRRKPGEEKPEPKKKDGKLDSFVKLPSTQAYLAAFEKFIHADEESEELEEAAACMTRNLDAMIATRTLMDALAEVDGSESD